MQKMRFPALIVDDLRFLFPLDLLAQRLSIRCHVSCFLFHWPKSQTSQYNVTININPLKQRLPIMMDCSLTCHAQQSYYLPFFKSHLIALISAEEHKYGCHDRRISRKYVNLKKIKKSWYSLYLNKYIFLK